LTIADLLTKISWDFHAIHAPPLGLIGYLKKILSHKYTIIFFLLLASDEHKEVFLLAARFKS